MAACLREWRRLLGFGLMVGLVPVGSAQAQREGARTGGSSGPAGHAGAPLVRAVTRPSPVIIDGRLDEPAWAAASPATDFRQQQPNDGQPATQRTEVRFLFDDEALYVGARMYDSEGGAGVRGRLVRRDQETDADWLDLIFDTFHNHVGRTAFSVNPSGARRDAGQASEHADASWDPVWEVRTGIDSAGWTAEIRVPFSQLRFPRDSTQTWGMQIWRNTSRLNEVSMWSYWSRNEAGGPPRFGHLEGLAIAAGTRRLELRPYVVGRSEFLRPGAPGDPFYASRGVGARAGLDVNYNLTSNLSLNATINPDFGQVEVDPAEVNLSTFETFFHERRPFFVEGSGVFGFGGFSCNFCSNVQSMSLFYSRRIGRAPQGALPAGTEYADVPPSSTILGAAKVTGRLAGGWTVGVLDAVTGRATARVHAGGAAGRQEVEPTTNYFVGRALREFRGGNLVLGAIGTSVTRWSDDPLVTGRMPRHAEALGFDWVARWQQRTYSFFGNVAMSSVTGSPQALDRIQRASARYFQRPDRDAGGNGLFSDRYDPAATSLRGWGGYARLSKEAGDWRWETAVNVRSPGFEANEIAFLTRADYLWGNANVLRVYNRPTSWYRFAAWLVGGQQQVNFDGDLTERQAQVFGRVTLHNYWDLRAFVLRRPDVSDDRLTRGGPVVRRPGSWVYQVELTTDGRRKVSLRAVPLYARGDEGAEGYQLNMQVRVRPATNLEFSVAPNYNHSENNQQYVAAVTDPQAVAFGGTRYVFADLRQLTFAFDTRLSATFTPGLTLELFAQPFISSVRHRQFKEYVAPRQAAKQVFGRDVGHIAPTTDAGGRTTGYTIDPDGAGPAAAFAVPNPDFSFRSLRGNAVLRWEYRPGATFFLVWTRTGQDQSPFTSTFDLGRDLDAMWSARTDNVFLVKMTYWLNR